MPTHSFRRDLSVSHDARGFVLASKGLAGWTCPRGKLTSAARVEGTKNGHFLSISMASKQGGTTLRVLLDKPLTPREQEEWIDHFAWKLRIPDGRLALIGGGDEYLQGTERDDDDTAEFLKVPAGDYRVDVYTCFTGVNGPELYEDGRDKAIIPAPIGAWFRRTRPSMKLPAWLRLHCYEDPESDPGHEDEYDDETFDYDAAEDEADEMEAVDFIVALSPLKSAPPLGDLPALKTGWFPVQIHPRRLDKCPRGLGSTGGG